MKWSSWGVFLVALAFSLWTMFNGAREVSEFNYGDAIIWLFFGFVGVSILLWSMTNFKW